MIVAAVQVEETLSPEILAKMHAPDKPDVPIISAKELPDADGFVFGMPTRYGMMAAQMKTLWDATGSLWQACAPLLPPLGAAGPHVTEGGVVVTCRCFAGRSAHRRAQVPERSVRWHRVRRALVVETHADPINNSRGKRGHAKLQPPVQASSQASRSRSSCPPAHRAAARRPPS